MQILNYKISNPIFIFIIILIILSTFNLGRLIHFIIFPNNNREETTEQILKYINYEIIIQFISWVSYLFLFLLLIYLNITQTRNIYIKIVLTLIFLILIYMPIFPILNIINLILILFIDNPPFIDEIEKEFPLNNLFEKKYNIIKEEYSNYNKNQIIDCFRYSNPLLSNIDTIDVNNNYCWRTLILKKAGKIIDEQKPFFPKTMELLENEQIHNAFFSVLDPHVEIKPHIGYYKGYLRYHLGIIIPNENGIKPYIICGGEKYEWEEGKGVLFDDMFLHYVNNKTNSQRVVLYLDIKRNNTNPIFQTLINIGNYITENSLIYDLFIKKQHIQNPK